MLVNVYVSPKMMYLYDTTARQKLANIKTARARLFFPCPAEFTAQNQGHECNFADLFGVQKSLTETPKIDQNSLDWCVVLFCLRVYPCPTAYVSF